MVDNVSLPGGGRGKRGGFRYPKKGNLARARTAPAPNKDIGLDWGGVRERYLLRVAQDAANGSMQPEAQIWRDNDLDNKSPEERERIMNARALQRIGAATPRRSSLTPAARSRGGSSSDSRKADVPEIVRLYVEMNLKPAVIAERMGLNVETVRTWLKRRGVWDKTKHAAGPGQKTPGSGIKATDTCHKGHKHPLGKGCSKCAVERTRDRRQNRGWM